MFLIRLGITVAIAAGVVFLMNFAAPGFKDAVLASNGSVAASILSVGMQAWLAEMIGRSQAAVWTLFVVEVWVMTAFATLLVRKLIAGAFGWQWTGWLAWFALNVLPSIAIGIYYYRVLWGDVTLFGVALPMIQPPAINAAFITWSVVIPMLVYVLWEGITLVTRQPSNVFLVFAAWASSIFPIGVVGLAAGRYYLGFLGVYVASTLQMNAIPIWSFGQMIELVYFAAAALLLRRSIGVEEAAHRA